MYERRPFTNLRVVQLYPMAVPAVPGVYNIPLGCTLLRIFAQKSRILILTTTTGILIPDIILKNMSKDTVHTQESSSPSMFSVMMGIGLVCASGGMVLYTKVCGFTNNCIHCFGTANIQSY